MCSWWEDAGTLHSQDEDPLHSLVPMVETSPKCYSGHRRLLRLVAMVGFLWQTESPSPFKCPHGGLCLVPPPFTEDPLALSPCP